MQALGMLVVVLNLAAAVGFIWLLVIGQWMFALGGLAAAVVMPQAFFLLNLPATWLVSRMSSGASPSTGGRLAITATALWSSVLLVAWTVLVFVSALALSEVDHVPRLLWGYGIVMGPLAYMAKFDINSSTTLITLVTAQLCYFGLGAFWYSELLPIVGVWWLVLCAGVFPLFAWLSSGRT